MDLTLCTLRPYSLWQQHELRPISGQGMVTLAEKP